jgi:dihydroorotase
LNTLAPVSIAPREWVQWLSTAPRNILGLPAATIEVGKFANLTLLDPVGKMFQSPSNFYSKSKNIPALNESLQGRVVGVIHQNRKQIFNQL